MFSSRRRGFLHLIFSVIIVPQSFLILCLKYYRVLQEYLRTRNQGKLEGVLISGMGGGGGYNRMIFFCFQVDGLITRRAYKWRGLISGGGLITGVLRYCDIRTK